MTQTNAAVNLALSTNEIKNTADAYDMDVGELSEALKDLDEYLAQGARAYYEAYEDLREETYDWPLVIVDAGHFMALYIHPEDWDTFQSDLGLSDQEREAAREVHTETARRMGAEEGVLADDDALIMAHPNVDRLMSAGLSRRQAEVQALRMDGATHETIADELGMALGTVKSHCQRIDDKSEKAEKLSTLLAE